MDNKEKELKKEKYEKYKEKERKKEKYFALYREYEKYKEKERKKEKEHEHCKNIINVDVNCCDNKKDKEDNHKKHDNCCRDYKKENVCCFEQKVERQVNNPANDVTNFPRITQSETSLAHFNEFILYGYNDFNIANNLSGFAFSNDLGDTWTSGLIPVNPGGGTDGDPVIAVDRNGVFYYGQLGRQLVGGTLQAVVSVSTGTINPNGTITMNLPQAVGRGQNPNATPASQDKEWIAVGPDADRPGNEALYITWTDFTVTPRNIRFSKYTTGVNLTPIITDQVIVAGGTNFVTGSFVIVDNQGVIYVFYEELAASNNIVQPNRTIRMLRSTDGGNTFPINVAVSAPFVAAANVVGPCGRPSIEVDNSRQIRNFEFPQAAIAPDGTLYVVWNAGRIVGNSRFIDILLAYSQDQGNTWNTVNISTPQNLAFSFLPSVAANEKGAHIQYNRFNDRRGRVGGVGDGTFAIFMKSFSPFDGLSEEKMISTEFSPVPVTNPNPQGPGIAQCYMGDYNQIIAGPGDCLLHSWGDNRNVINQRDNPDVFFRRTVPKNKNHNYDCN